MLFATNEHARRQEAGESATDPDAIFATSMLALADLRAALPGALRSKPHVLYMHENQAAYPVSDHVERTIRDQDSHLAFTNLASIEAADRVLWNSVWNRDSFIAGMETTLAHAPERSVDRWQDRLLNKSVITPPPIEPPEETEGPEQRPRTTQTPRFYITPTLLVIQTRSEWPGRIAGNTTKDAMSCCRSPKRPDAGNRKAAHESTGWCLDNAFRGFQTR